MVKICFIKGSFEYMVYENGDIWSIKGNRYLKQHPNQKGYMQVTLYEHKRRTTRTVHRIVAEAFLDNHCNYPQINHIDGVKTNNHANNLEFCTQSMNLMHASGMGLLPDLKGEKHPSAKLNNITVRVIRATLKLNMIAQKEVADFFNISHPTVSAIKSRRSWRHI